MVSAFQKKWRASGVWALAFGVFACSVDERDLHFDGGAGAGAMGEGAGPSNGANGNVPDAGEGAAPGEGGSAGNGVDVSVGGEEPTWPHLPPLVGGCADLDTDSVADCSVTLVENPAFKTDITSWAPVGDSALSWDAKNALEDKPSGCALLTAQGTNDIEGSALFRASQCIPAGAGRLVIAYTNTWVARNASPAVQAHAELQVSYFDAEDCSGSATGYFVTPPSTAAETWETIHGGGVTGPATKAILVMIVGVKPYRTASMSACFDNLMVKFKDE